MLPARAHVRHVQPPLLATATNRRRQYMPNRNRAVPVRVWFWTKLAPSNADGCREWTGAISSYGYGVVALPASA